MNTRSALCYVTQTITRGAATRSSPQPTHNQPTNNVCITPAACRFMSRHSRNKREIDKNSSNSRELTAHLHDLVHASACSRALIIPWRMRLHIPFISAYIVLVGPSAPSTSASPRDKQHDGTSDSRFNVSSVPLVYLCVFF